MNSQGIIIEGVTGAGKTNTMNELLSSQFVREQWSPYDLFREKETFGEFMGELREHPDAPIEQKLRLLAKVVRTATARAEQNTSYHFIMERVHYSYYALLPEWNLYETFDNRLAALNPHIFLLWVPDDHLKRRSLYRLDRESWGDGFINLYGSELAALDAIRSSQDARLEAIRKSVIPHTVIDTSAMEWDRYSNEIAAQMQRFRRRTQRDAGR